MATATSGQGRRWSDKRGQEVGLGGRLLGTAVVTSAETHPGGSLTYCWDRLHPGTMSESGLCGYGSDIVHAIPSGGSAIAGELWGTDGGVWQVVLMAASVSLYIILEETPGGLCWAEGMSRGLFWS